jgi:hypothetical protein
MGRLSDQARQRNEAGIRAAMDQLLRGEIPPGGKSDIKTLAAEAGVTRTGFYPKGERRGPYQHLAEEFERRLAGCHATGNVPDPRDAQISRLKTRIDTLQQRISRSRQANADLTAFKTAALSQLTAQHQEITRLRTALEQTARIRRLPATPSTGT